MQSGLQKCAEHIFGSLKGKEPWTFFLNVFWIGKVSTSAGAKSPETGRLIHYEHWARMTRCQDAKMPVTHWPVSPRSRSAMAYDQSMQMWRLSLQSFSCKWICERQRCGMSALSGFRVQMCIGNFCPTIYFQVCCLCPMAKARNLPDMAQRKSAFLVKSGPMKAGWEVVM